MTAMTTLKIIIVLIAIQLVLAKTVPQKPRRRLTQLKIEKCGGDNTFHLNKLALDPYPVELPSNTTVSIDAEMDHLIVGPFDVDVEIHRSILFWIPVPCIDGVGSCTYKNICQHPQGTGKQKEIERIFGFPLQGCIIPKFKLALTVYDIALPDMSWFVDILADGSYRIQFTVRNKYKVITCQKIYIEID